MPKTLSLGDGVQRHRENTARHVSVTDLESRFQPNPAISMTALAIKMGPFDAVRDAFRFNNSFPITDATQLRLGNIER